MSQAPVSPPALHAAQRSRSRSATAATTLALPPPSPPSAACGVNRSSVRCRHVVPVDVVASELEQPLRHRHGPPHVEELVPRQRIARPPPRSSPAPRRPPRRYSIGVRKQIPLPDLHDHVVRQVARPIAAPRPAPATAIRAPALPAATRPTTPASACRRRSALRAARKQSTAAARPPAATARRAPAPPARRRSPPPCPAPRRRQKLSSRRSVPR